MPVKHLLSVVDLPQDGLLPLVEMAVAIAEGRLEGQRPLAGRTVGIYFRRVLSNYLDALVIRTNDAIEETRELASQAAWR